jgi:hypothetical protein
VHFKIKKTLPSALENAVTDFNAGVVVEVVGLVSEVIASPICLEIAQNCAPVNKDFTRRKS